MGTDPLDTFNANAENGALAANLALLSVDCHGLVLQDGSVAEFGPG